MPFYRGLDVQGDLRLTADGRDFVLVTGREQILQAIKIRAQIFKGSWRYDLNKGLPYLDEILVAGPQRELVRRRFYEMIMGTAGVTSVTRLELRFDQKNGIIYVEFTCIAEGEPLNGVLDFVATT